MVPLVIQHHHDAANETCALCGQRTLVDEGPQLFVADSLDAVCRDCGRKHAPSLVALLDLARDARRIGRLPRHTVFPPLTALLDLARAAENYAQALPRRFRQVA